MDGPFKELKKTCENRINPEPVPRPRPGRVLDDLLLTLLILLCCTMGELYTLCDVQYVLMYLISVLLYHHHLPFHPFHLLLHKLHHLLLLHNLHHLL